ncbi:hypothetical protein PHYPSEUDO_004146 [Phytophthora pseudosyringae]|uniref:BZIP domain-containing protein n=1 Tax=Phytophthora pseudosyringae TaxID=221518 RepID=A0A8T1WH26_9STRA|nr:hypothetical protein PHYPSEUDO_004146 [Phytophthora pseudosyringae]
MAPSVPYKAASIDSADLAKLERRRAQTRTRQLRYIQKKRQYESDLKASVATLWIEVQRMHQHLHQLQNVEPHSSSARISSSSAAGIAASNILQTAQDFIHCFRSGFATTAAQPWLPCVAPDQEQIRFVQRSIHPDVRHGELRGQNSFLEQWRRYTTFFGSFALHPNSFRLLSRSAGHVVYQVQLTMSLGLVFATFRSVFPHLLQPQHSALFSRLLNQQIHVPATLLLQFDAQGRVCHYDPSLNFVEALRLLLSSYEDVAAVLQDARISPCGYIGRDVSRSRDARLAVSFVLSPIDP